MHVPPTVTNRLRESERLVKGRRRPFLAIAPLNQTRTVSVLFGPDSNHTVYTCPPDLNKARKVRARPTGSVGGHPPSRHPGRMLGVDAGRGKLASRLGGRPPMRSWGACGRLASSYNHGQACHALDSPVMPRLRRKSWAWGSLQLFESMRLATPSRLRRADS